MSALYKMFGFNVDVTFLLFTGLLVALGISILVTRLKNKKFNAFMASLPGPTPLPLIGTLYVIFGTTSENLCDTLRKHMEKYPRLAAHWIAGEPVLITGDRDIMNAIYNCSYNVEKVPEYRFFKNGCDGLFTASGNEWRELRKALNPSFKTNILVSNYDSLNNHIQPFLNNLQKYADDGKELNIIYTVHMCTADLFFDIMCESQTDIQKNNLVYLTEDLREAAEMIHERMFSPLLWPDWVYSLIGKQKKFEKTIARGRAFIQDEILEQKIKSREKLKETNPMTERPQTFMELLLSSIDSGLITKHHAREEIVEMSIAGSLTSAVTIAWIFKLLAMFPEFQQRAYQEVVETCSEGKVTLNDLSKLVYVEMVIKETLRHFAPPVVARRMVKDLELNDKFTIPEGIRVLLGSFELHHDPLYWAKPYEFDPEHFSEANEKIRPKGTFLPFSAGPRGCPGYRVAMMSAKFIVAHTLLNYKFFTDRKPLKDFWDLEYRFIIMVWPTEGFKVRVKRRQANL